MTSCSHSEQPEIVKVAQHVEAALLALDEKSFIEALRLTLLPLRTRDERGEHTFRLSGPTLLRTCSKARTSGFLLTTKFKLGRLT